ncbi:hypothetical protein GPECTOR_95g688 [Gonium pectorale]|uniref:Dynein assembly factor 3, axonemal n=1 Tax=Gonium pectorale TaxID=33097 RepID=A0A150G0C1_GONPE|nr:hypothetical protein GPECTOR_95g688 [Gonium pectorale]|eukprot:KXZ43299.1 hypothetical protein GPECTOR_95g688 [Gonium pectorale]
MDEQNVHQFWGISPALDLGSLLPRSDGEDGAADLPVDQPIRILQVAPYDARHTLTTICRASRHPLLERQQQPVTLYVWEDCPEGLARHLLLLSLLLDGGLLGRERGQLLLELHGNAMLRQRAAEALDEKARQLESLVVSLGSGSPPAPDLGDPRGLGALAAMLDLSMLKFQERDLLVEALQKWRSNVAYDMVKAWDARARKWYGDRYDFRRNMVDWDYHMRLQPAGTPGVSDPSAGSIIHFHHFRHWRAHGVAHELRDASYNHPNRSLLSTAYGRTREFKDRTGRDVGRSVSAWGFWGDTLNGPYHCFGTLAEEPAFYKISNKQFTRTAVDIAEHNLEALLHELRTGSRLTLGEGAEAHRARVARGPTSLEDLAGQGREGEGQGTEGHAERQPEALEEQRPDRSEQQGGSAPSGEAGVEAAQSASSCPSGAAEVAGAGAQQEESPGAVPTYSSGGRAQVAKSVAAAAAAAAAAAPSPASTSPLPAEPPGAGEAGTDQADASAPSPPSAAAASSATGGRGAVPVHGDAAVQRMAAEEAALRAAEAAQDGAARRRAARFRLVLLTGDLAKGVTGRAKFAGAFSALTLGHRHAHLLGPEGGLLKAAAPGAAIVAENARHVLQLTREQADLFVTKMDEMAAAAGWERLAERPAGVTEASQVYRRPAAGPAGGA